MSFTRRTGGPRRGYEYLYMEELPAGWFVCAGCMGVESTDDLAGFVLSPAKNRFPLCGDCYADAARELPGGDLRKAREESPGPRANGRKAA